MNIALSGIAAQFLRTSVSANNIANAQSTKVMQDGQQVDKIFIPQDVYQLSDANGGTTAYIKDSGKAPISSYDPTFGVVQTPNVDLATELVKVNEASINFQANLKIAVASSKLLGSFIDKIV